ncbi:MAG: DUF2764 family protein [Candidatus Omnitrophica bacterium]|nr:DUF2764 family protein [Candidatus Omnitrophota bacterium]
MVLLENSRSLEPLYCRSCGVRTFSLWQSFEKQLRNELVKLRAHYKHIDPVPYLKAGGLDDISISHIALASRKIPSLMAAEEFLDKERWQKLEDLAFGHYFDMEYLVTYAQKLLILERWERIRAADKSRLLEEVLQKT